LDMAGGLAIGKIYSVQICMPVFSCKSYVSLFNMFVYRSDMEIFV
jgi:hypothetical protein